MEKRINKHLYTWIAAFLFGVLGVNRFMRGQIFIGIIKIITIGGVLVWFIIDLIIAIIKLFSKNYGREFVFINGKWAPDDKIQNDQQQTLKKEATRPAEAAVSPESPPPELDKNKHENADTKNVEKKDFSENNSPENNENKKMRLLTKITVILAIGVGLFIILNFIFSFFENEFSFAAAQSSLRAESNMVFVEQVYRRVFFVRNSTMRGSSERLENQLLFSVNYILRAGINMSDLELSDRNGALVVTYNKPEIFSVKIDYSSLEFPAGVTRRNQPVRMRHFVPLINGGVTGLEEGMENGIVIHEEIEKIEDIAVQNGIEQTVRQNAQWWFSGYLGMLGFNNIIFEERP